MTLSVQKIVEHWLKSNNYTGLYCEECGCEIDDLMPCAGFNSGIDRCNAGYKVHCDTNCSDCHRNEWCDMDPEFADWYISENREG